MTLREYRIRLGWSVHRLACEAGIARKAAANADLPSAGRKLA
jgi:hypothetical protein